MTIQANLSRCAAVALTITVVSSASAQNITPSHVYQVVDNVNGELALMHEANGSKAKADKKAPALTKRRPRHVIQKAREVFLKVQELRKINGLSVNQVPTFPVREVRPADVKEIVAAVLKSVRDLRPKFKITKPSPSIALASGKIRPMSMETYRSPVVRSMGSAFLAWCRTVFTDSP